jgi:hypothetical protein
MIAADDFLEPFTTAHDLHDQATRLGMPFAFVDEIAFFETHEAGSRIRMTVTKP